MNDKNLQFILMHLLYSQIKRDDAPASAQGHFDLAIVELNKLTGDFELDAECKQVLNDAVEHMKLYNR